MYSEHELTELHNELLYLLKQFHKFCVKNDIKYSIHGGTLLGAVREKGFIPWDDDADVTMTRVEYEKFYTAVQSANIGEEFSFMVVDRAPRFVMKREGKPAVCIDIIIYDYISENVLSQKCKIYGIMFLGGMMKTKESMVITKERGTYSKWKYGMYYLAYLLGRLFSEDLKLCWFERFSKNCFCGKKKLIHRSNDQYIGIIIVLPAEIMSRYEAIQFEDTELMASSNYHEILLSSYGEDYMTPKRYADNELEVHTKFRKMLEKGENQGD